MRKHTVRVHWSRLKFVNAATLSVANLSTLASRRDEISIKFFAGITVPSSCLHHLLPAQKEQSFISRLRSHFLGFYRAMHFSAKRGIVIACRLSVCLSVCL